MLLTVSSTIQVSKLLTNAISNSLNFVFIAVLSENSAFYGSTFLLPKAIRSLQHALPEGGAGISRAL
jgi:hypothetical protein